MAYISNNEFTQKMILFERLGCDEIVLSAAKNFDKNFFDQSYYIGALADKKILKLLLLD
jgi:hypothetical protein